MANIKHPNSLNLSEGNLSENWRRFKRELDNFIVASEKDKKSDKVKIAIFQTYIGDEGLELFDSFQLSADEVGDYGEILKRFEAHCNPRKNVVMERFKFRNTFQKTSQTINDFLTSLKLRISSCEYENEDLVHIKDHLVRDQLVIGLTDKSIQERLLRENDIDLEKAVKLVKAWEDSQNHSKELNALSKEVDAVKSYAGAAAIVLITLRITEQIMVSPITHRILIIIITCSPARIIAKLSSIIIVVRMKMAQILRIELVVIRIQMTPTSISRARNRDR